MLQMDPSYVPAQIEHKQVFGITFEQGRNNANRNLPKDKLDDMAIAMITLKYTQSNSVCYVKGGQAIGIGAGQQSRIHCTRLAGSKADNWWLRQSPQVLNLPFRSDIKRVDKDNAIDLYIGDEYEDVLADGRWQAVFTRLFLQRKRRGHGSAGTPMWFLVRTLSSRLETISSGRSAPA